MKLTINIHYFISFAVIFAAASATIDSQTNGNGTFENSSAVLNSSSAEYSGISNSAKSVVTNVSRPNIMIENSNEQNFSMNSSKIMESAIHSDLNTSQSSPDESATSPNPTQSISNQNMSSFVNATSSPFIISASNSSGDLDSEMPTSPRPFKPYVNKNATNSSDFQMIESESNSSSSPEKFSTPPSVEGENFSVSPVPKTGNFSGETITNNMPQMDSVSPQSVSMSPPNASVMNSSMQSTPDLEREINSNSTAQNSTLIP